MPALELCRAVSQLITSFESASNATHVQLSPWPFPQFFCWTFLSFDPTNDQISSTWTFLVESSRTVRS